MVVITSGGSATLTNGYTYAVAPAVTSISPTRGPLGGGTTVIITGTGFYGGGSSPAVSAVKFGSTSATSFTVNSATQITATSPAGSGTVDVTVTTPGGTSATTAADRFTYSTAPTVASITPTGGPLAGGTTVTITGTGFISGATVKIGGTAASNVVVTNATTITATTPAGTAGAKSVVVTNTDTQSSNTNIAFTYAAAPTIISITPNSGSAAGGTAVTITGTGFVNGSTIIIGVNQATNITVKSDNTITASTPAGSTGTTDVYVTNPDTQRSNTNITFTYTGSGTVTTTPTTPTASTTTTTATDTNTTTTTNTSEVTTTTPVSTSTATTSLTTSTTVGTPHPAAFAAASLIINPAKVKPSENVSVSLRITNAGDVAGTDTVVLKINNLIIESKDVTLGGGESTVVTFTTSSNLIGKYSCEVAGLYGNFTVSKSVTPGWVWPSSIGAFILGIVMAVGFVLLRKTKT